MMMNIITSTLSILTSPLTNLCTNILVYASQGILILSIIFAVAFHVGWIHRWIWHVVEYELSKAALNHGACRLTVGSFEYDLLRGRVWASNVIIHSPNRAAWKWASPVLARVGKVYVETNLVWVLLSMWFLWEEPPLEVYTLHVSDIQCFVERKHQVFNVHLLDPRNVIPDPSTLMDEQPSQQSTQQDAVDGTTTSAAAAAMDDSMEQTLQDTNSNAGIHHRRARTSSSAADLSAVGNQDGTASNTSLDTMLTGSDHHNHQENNNTNTEQGNNDNDDDDDKEGEQTAQRLVNDMILAVESLGQAVQHGSLPRALNEQRQQIAQRLKRVVMGHHHQEDTNNNNNNNNSDPTTSIITTSVNASKAMKQGVKIVQQVGKAVVEKTQSVQKVVLPTRRAPRKNQKIVYARFGRVVIDDMRVFTRNYKKSKLLSQQQHQQQQHHQRQIQLQQQQAATSSNKGDGISGINDIGTGTAAAATPSSPGVKKSEPQTSPTTTPIIPTALESQSAAATPVTSRTTASDASSSSSAAAAAASLQYASLTSAWNKPIVVKRCAVRASEFCPPLNAKEGDDLSPSIPYHDNNFNGFPVLYQPIEKCMDAILKRVVADMAKANNGRIFQTALGEVLDYWSTLESKDNNFTTSSSSNDLRNSAASEQTTL